MIIEGKLIPFGEDLTEVFDIRRKVFVEEQGISENIVFDEYDYLAIHAIVFQGTNQGKAIATGRMVYDGDSCTLGFIAVLKEHRGNQYGDFVVRMLINKAFNAGVERVIVNAQVENVDLYKKIGFIQEGEEFIAEGLQQIRMTISRECLITQCIRNKEIEEEIQE